MGARHEVSIAELGGERDLIELLAMSHRDAR